MRAALLALALLASPAAAAPMLCLPPTLAAQLASATRADGDTRARLEPRPVLAGPCAGGSVVGTAVLADPAYAAWHQTLAAQPVVEIDPAVAWPGQE